MMMFLPEGSRDEMGSVVNKRFHVMEVFRKVVSTRGYQQIATPLLEYATTFTNEHVGMKLQEMMKWFNANGDIEVLRPDWTIAIARALSTQPQEPQKYAYQGSVFKLNTPGVEFHQIGIEMIHIPDLMGESESLLMAQTFLKQLGVGSCIIELGHTDIYESLAQELSLSTIAAENLRQAMHDKKKDEVYQIAKANGSIETAEELAALVDAFGSIEIIAEYEHRWENRKDLLEILQHIKQLVAILQQSGSEDILVDLGRVKNQPYYSGMMFRGFLPSSGVVCFSGGRYDRLYEQFGNSVSAVGLAFDVDVLVDQVQDSEQKETICIIASPETISYSEQIRSEFPEAIVDVQSEPVDREKYDKVLEIVNRNGKYEVVEK
ncbi:MAG TPA: ATP phosphoribosyltransferase regulatory subunit [Bacillaceae bacterium]|nr:ATP phosphoribosyltransferase regulatory subunit [Bacillaceae bacterium]